MSALSVVIKTEPSGRLSLVPLESGRFGLADHRKVEAEASRMRFRDDRASYCVYTGLFASTDQARQFIEMRNAGVPINRAMKKIRVNP
jgi:hypothetical protein